MNKSNQKPNLGTRRVFIKGVGVGVGIAFGVGVIIPTKARALGWLPSNDACQSLVKELTLPIALHLRPANETVAWVMSKTLDLKNEWQLGKNNSTDCRDTVDTFLDKYNVAPDAFNAVRDACCEAVNTD